MATVEGLNLLIGGTVTGLDAAINSTVKSLNKLAPASSAAAAGITNLSNAINSGQASILQASKGFGVLQQSFADTVKYEKDFIAAAKSGNLALGTQASAAQRLGKALQTTKGPAEDTNVAIKSFGASSSKTGLAVMNFGRVLSDLPYGFIAIQNNIDPLLQSLGIGAGLGLAFTVAGSLATILIQKYGSLGGAIAELTGSISDAERVQMRFNSITEEAGKSAGAEIAKLELIRSALLDVNTPLDERTKLIDEYNKTADKSNQIDAKQIDNTSKLNQLIDAQIDLIGKRALAKAAENKLGEAAGKLLDVELKTKPVLDRLTNALSAQGEAAADAIKGLNILGVASVDQAAAAPGLKERYAAQLLELSKIRNTPEFKAAQKELDEARKEFNAQLGQIAGVVDIEGLSEKASTDKSEKSIKTIKDVLDDLNNSLLKTNSLFVNSGESLDKLTDAQIANYRKALSDLIDIKVLPGDALFDQIKSRLDALVATHSGVVKIPIPIQIDPIPQAESNNTKAYFDSEVGRMNAQWKDAVDNFNPNLDQFSAKLNGQLKVLQSRGLADLGAGLGEAVGDIASGATDLSGALNSVVGIIADFAISFGKALIAAGTATLAADILITNPFTAIAAGVLAVAAGTIIKNASKKVPSFAVGGVVNGPTLAMVGDNPSGREAMIPEELWPYLGGGSDSVFIPDVRIKGKDIVIAFNRANKEEKRVR